MRQKALRSFPNRYLFNLYHKVTSSFSIRYVLEIIFARKMTRFAMILNAFIAQKGADYGIKHSLKNLLYCQYCMGDYPILPK